MDRDTTTTVLSCFQIGSLEIMDWISEAYMNEFNQPIISRN